MQQRDDDDPRPVSELRLAPVSADLDKVLNTCIDPGVAIDSAWAANTPDDINWDAIFKLAEARRTVVNAVEVPPNVPHTIPMMQAQETAPETLIDLPAMPSMYGVTFEQYLQEVDENHGSAAQSSSWGMWSQRYRTTAPGAAGLWWVIGGGLVIAYLSGVATAVALVTVARY